MVGKTRMIVTVAGMHRTMDWSQNYLRKKMKEEADNAPKCPDCAKIFTSIKGYNQHMKRVHNKESFLSFTSFGFHAKRSHKMQDLKDEGFGVMVKEIFEKFTTARNYGTCGANRVIIHIIKMSCRGKHPQIRTGNRLDHTLEDVIVRNFHCVYYRHMRVKHQTTVSEDYFRSGKVDVRMFSAWNVGKILQGKLSLRRHMLACHTKQCDEQGMMLLCPECGHTFTNQSCFRKHMQLAHTKEKYGCALVFTVVTSLSRHMRHKHQATNFYPGMYYKCLKCGEYFTTREYVNAHLRITREKSVSCKTHSPDGMKMKSWMYGLSQDPTHEEEKAILCPECGLTFSDKFYLARHKRSMHSNKRHVCLMPAAPVFWRTKSSSMVPQEFGVSYFVCLKCNGYLPSRERMAAHIRIDSKASLAVKRFKCELCSYSTNYRGYIQRHVLARHTPEPRPRPFVCDQCGKSYLDRSMLSQHRQQIHVRDKTFHCHFCPKFFYQKRLLTQHLRTHSGLRPHGFKALPRVHDIGAWRQATASMMPGGGIL
nr:hypothetical protein BaRGS_011167 [Batillaria attramentaria]